MERQKTQAMSRGKCGRVFVSSCEGEKLNIAFVGIETDVLEVE